MPILVFFSSGFAIMAPGSGISAAERQRIRRQIRDADPQKRADYLRKKKEKYAEDKAKGKIKLIKDLKPTEQRTVRKKWRLQKQEQRKVLKETAQVEMTPQQSPEGSKCNVIPPISTALQKY